MLLVSPGLFPRHQKIKVIKGKVDFNIFMLFVIKYILLVNLMGKITFLFLEIPPSPPQNLSGTSATPTDPTLLVVLWAELRVS